MARVKICGLSRPEDIDYANAASPDYIGFVFAESRRKVTAEAASAMKKRLSPTIKAAGVFVDAEQSFIAEICKKGIIDIIQLHGAEDGEYIAAVKALTGKPVIKAFRVKGAKEAAEAENSPADWVLFDAYSPKAAGGTGVTFDWSAVEGVRRPFFLAGGLDVSNIESAFGRLDPFCFDVSGGAETCGFKDGKKMADIVKLVRSLK